MKVITILLFIFQVLYSQERMEIAVMDLDGEGFKDTEISIISSRLRTELVNTKNFIVIEREKMNEILTEQGFQLSGCTTNECIVEAGQLLGVSQIVAGTVGSLGNLITINIRLIDVETGKINKTATVDCECEIETFLTESIVSVSKILSGDKIIPNDLFLNEENNEWKKLGISYADYIEYQRSGLKLNQWLIQSKSKDPERALLLSSLLPGAGQYYNGDYAKGVLQQSLVFLGIWAGLNFGPYGCCGDKALYSGLAVSAITWVWSAIDAKNSALDFNIELKKQYSYNFNSKDNNLSGFHKICDITIRF